MLARYDAISAAARDTYRMLASNGEWDVRVLTLRNDYADVPATTVSGIADLLIHPAYLAADLLIYHFGMYSDLINALIIGNGHARQVVRYHNITPKHLVATAQWNAIEDSFRQVSNLNYADEIWADSVVNKAEIEEHGIEPERIRVIPLAVDAPATTSLSDKLNQPVQLLFLGRIVASKGVLDLVKALDLARRRVEFPMRLRLVGNMEWSDHSYLEGVERFISGNQLEDAVEIRGSVSDAERERYYHDAHIFAIPSYHEGFCMPVVEALRSGCIPIGYDAYNLPYIANGFGRLVAPGDIHALAGALVEVARCIAPARRAPDAPLLPLDRGTTSAHEFEAATANYVETFTIPRLAVITQGRVAALFNEGPEGPGPGKAIIELDVKGAPSTAQSQQRSESPL